RLVSELSATAALSQRHDALYRHRARGHRDGEWRPRRQAAERALAIALPQSRGGTAKSEPLLHAWRTQARPQARVDGKRLLACDLGIHKALRFQGRLHRWMGRLRHRIRKFRRNLLSLR